MADGDADIVVLVPGVVLERVGDRGVARPRDDDVLRPRVPLCHVDRRRRAKRRDQLPLDGPVCPRDVPRGVIVLPQDEIDRHHVLVALDVRSAFDSGGGEAPIRGALRKNRRRWPRGARCGAHRREILVPDDDEAAVEQPADVRVRRDVEESEGALELAEPSTRTPLLTP